MKKIGKILNRTVDLLNNRDFYHIHPQFNINTNTKFNKLR